MQQNFVFKHFNCATKQIPYCFHKKKMTQIWKSMISLKNVFKMYLQIVQV